MEIEQAQRKTPFQAYGVQCGAGWKGLYEPLLQLCTTHGVEVAQVKEKFGGLRFYTTGAIDAGFQLLIEAAEEYSYRTCEDCGEHGFRWNIELGEQVSKVTTGPSETSGWIRSLCAPCRTAWDAKRQIEIDAHKARMAKTRTSLEGDIARGISDETPKTTL